jgi:hypothetical protein
MTGLCAAWSQYSFRESTCCDQWSYESQSLGLSTIISSWLQPLRRETLGFYSEVFSPLGSVQCSPPLFTQPLEEKSPLLQDSSSGKDPASFEILQLWRQSKVNHRHSLAILQTVIEFIFLWSLQNSSFPLKLSFHLFLRIILISF